LDALKDPWGCGTQVELYELLEPGRESQALDPDTLTDTTSSTALLSSSMTSQAKSYSEALSTSLGTVELSEVSEIMDPSETVDEGDNEAEKVS
jgi:hypothetical protein